MTCVEYHDVPLSESGVVRKGESQVWFKDFVHDVFSSFLVAFLMHSSAKYLLKSFLQAQKQDSV